MTADSRLAAFVDEYCRNGGDVREAAAWAGVPPQEALVWMQREDVRAEIARMWGSSKLSVGLSDAKVRDVLVDENAKPADILAAAALTYKRLGADAESRALDALGESVRQKSAAELWRLAVEYGVHEGQPAVVSGSAPATVEPSSPGIMLEYDGSRALPPKPESAADTADTAESTSDADG